MATVAPSLTAVSDRRGNRPDSILLSMVLLLSGFGLLMIYSATRFGLERAEQIPTGTMERQMIFVTAGLIAIGMFSFIDYREYRNFLPVIYGAIILMLLAVFLFPEVNGAQRWIPIPLFNLQPAEFTKPVVIVAMAYVLSQGADPDRVRWRQILQILVLAGLPAALILLEPDLGTTLTIPFVMLVMLFAAGANWKQLTTLIGSGIVAVAAAFRFDLLQDHQERRIRVFLDPDVDPQGMGFQLRQSKLAIGSGQLTGKGLFEGTQTNLAYVPEAETDFIFTAVGEQLGFVGGVILVTAFLVLIWRLLVIAAHARDRFGSLIAVGISGMLVFHVFVNIGMTVGIAPVTGLPLPFLSLGGSFYLAMAMSIGIANSIWLKRSPVPDRLEP
ncbi:MAG: rod shape-determining protein RodA [Acidimicrobiia bacterium]|nr:rod shape-determining protein RodA [Acidimicrobiia bacterium]